MLQFLKSVLEVALATLVERPGEQILGDVLDLVGERSELAIERFIKG